MINLIAIILLFCFIYFTSVCLQLNSFADDPGVGWHLKTGEYIINNKWPPTVDPFLHSSSVKPWVSDQWLSDLLLKSLYDIGGFPALYALGISVFLLVFGLILPLMLKRFHIPSFTIVFCCALAAKLASIHLILRPVLFSFIFFSLAFANFVYWERSGGTYYKKISTCLYLGALFVLWSNMHPSFALGILLLAFGVIGHLIDKFFLDRERSTSSFYVRLLFIIICLGATLATPYGFALHDSVYSLTNSQYFMSLHEEWKPLPVNEGAGHLFIQTVCAIFILAYFFRNQLAKISTFEVITFTFFLYHAFSSARYLPYFAIVSTPVLAALLTPLEIFLSNKFHRISSTTSMPTNRAINLTTGIVICSLIGLCSYASYTGTIPLYKGSFGPTKERYPYAAVDKLVEMAGGQPTSVFSHPNWGGFIAWRSNGVLKPIIDDRNSVTEEERYKKIIPATTDIEKAIDISKVENITYILLANSQKLKDSNRAKELYRDSQSAIFSVSRN